MNKDKKINNIYKVFLKLISDIDDLPCDDQIDILKDMIQDIEIQLQTVHRYQTEW